MADSVEKWTKQKVKSRWEVYHIHTKCSLIHYKVLGHVAKSLDLGLQSWGDDWGVGCFSGAGFDPIVQVKVQVTKTFWRTDWYVCILFPVPISIKGWARLTSNIRIESQPSLKRLSCYSCKGRVTPRLWCQSCASKADVPMLLTTQCILYLHWNWSIYIYSTCSQIPVLNFPRKSMESNAFGFPLVRGCVHIWVTAGSDSSIPVRGQAVQMTSNCQ